MHDGEIGVPEDGRAESDEEMTADELHVLGCALLALISHRSLDRRDHVRLKQLIEVFRVQREAHASECEDCGMWSADDYWQSLPEETRRRFEREAVEVQWLNDGWAHGLSPFPPAGTDQAEPEPPNPAGGNE